MKEKLKNSVKENKWLLITFIVSSIVVSIIYMFNHIAPFGKNSMLDVDFYHQYGPFLNELYDRVKQGENLLYSFNTGGGIPFYRNFLNYLSSPFNLIMFLFRKKDIVMAFSVIIGFKAVAASCTMSYYLKKTFKKDNVFLSVFGILYAFSGYFCAYYWNIMWLDGMVFLPLIMLGINKIIDEKKPLFYTIFLATMLFANYFIGYMICIFSVLYFLGYFIYRGDFKLKNILTKFLMFGIFSILAAGLVSFAILPLFYSLSSISATKDVFPEISTNFTFSNYLFNHLSGVDRTVFASDKLPLPNVYAGLITLLLILILFINKKINLKAKLIAITALFFFFLSFNINVIDFIWHAFHVPNDLPYRYSFIYVFILTVIAYYSAINLKSVSKLGIGICFMIIFIFTMLASKLSFQNMTNNKIIVCLILIACYYFTYLISNIKVIPKVLIYILLVSIASCEVIYSININWDINHDIEIFMSDKKPYKELISKAKKEDNDLYRIEKTESLTLNDPSWYDYYGMSTFSSMAYEKVSKFQRLFGLPGNNINSYYYKKVNTPIYNTIFNIRYLMGSALRNNYYDLAYSNETANLYRYKYPSSLIYMVNKDIKKMDFVTFNPFLNQENFVSLASGIDGIYEPLKLEKVSIGSIIEENFYDNPNGEFNYELTEDENCLKFSLLNPKKQNVYIYVGGYEIKSFIADGNYYDITSDEYYIVDLGTINSETIDIQIDLNNSKSGDIKFYAYTINEEKFNEFYNYIKEGSLSIKKYSDTFILGDINAKEKQIAFTSISYDEGWSVYVDNKKVETYILLDSYLGFDVPKGKHEIKLCYYPPKMKLGLIISGISLILLFVYFLYEERENNKNIEKDKIIV